MTNIRHVILATMLLPAATFSLRSISKPKPVITDLNNNNPRKHQNGGLFQSAVPLEGQAYDAALNQPQDFKPADLSVDFVRSPTSTKKSPKQIMGDLYQSYLRSIEERPYRTKALTAAVVNFFGDMLAQFIEASNAGVPFVPNWMRLQGFFLCGLLYIGPYVHTWYQQLWKMGSWMEKKYDSPKQVQTIAQLVLDQTIGVVIFFSTYFYVYEIIDALVSHRLPIMSAASAKVAESFGPVLMTNYYFWPAVNFVSFNYVPVQLRVLVNNVVGVLWNAFLCAKLAG